MRENYIFAAVVVIVAIMLSACGNSIDPQESITPLLTRLYTYPNQEFADSNHRIEQEIQSGIGFLEEDPHRYDDEIQGIIRGIYGDGCSEEYVDKLVISPSVFILNLMQSNHSEDRTLTVESIVYSEINADLYRYRLQLKATYTDGSQKEYEALGRVQFDGDGKIIFVGEYVGDYYEFYQNLSE